MSKEIAIELKNVEIKRDGTTVISGMSTQFIRGTITAVIGPNGSGKSSLLSAMSGALPISQGSIFLNNKSIVEIPLSAQAKLRSVVLQNQRYALGFSVAQILALGTRQIPMQDIESVLSKLGSLDLLSRSVLSLSGGERQRISIAHALIQGCDLILLDEPLSAQDPESKERIIEIFRELKREGKTVIFVAHMEERELDWCDQIIKTLSQQRP
jgi:iron complex transport system ATP-binding protein